MPFKLVQQALQQVRPIGARGRCTDEVTEDEIIGLPLAPLSSPGCQQGRLSGTRFAQDHEGRAVPICMLGQSIEIGLSADVYAGSTVRKRLMFGGLATNRGEWRAFRKALVDDGSQVVAN